MSSCDDEILLLDPSKDWPAPSSSAAAVTAGGASVVAVSSATNGDAEFSDEEQHHQFHPHHHLLAVGFKRQQLEISPSDIPGLPSSAANTKSSGAASSDGSEREQADNSDDAAKGPSAKRLKQQQQQHSQQQQQQQQQDSFKKDREEWSDTAICALLDAYTEKFLQLNKGNLRGRHWQEVSNMVSMRCQGQKSVKTIEQCKNKVDSLKKRHKVERTRMENTGSTTSQWPWFSKVEQIVGSAPKLSVLLDDDASMMVKSEKQKSSARQRRPNCRTPSVSPCANSLGFHTSKTKLLQPRWQRVVLKVSGDALAGDRVQNVDQKITLGLAKEVASAMRLGVEVAVVVGGGNFFRGANWVGASGLDRASADHIGMMATMMNAVFLQASFESIGIKTRIQTAYSMPQVAEPYFCKKALRHMEKGRVVILGGGTGNPFFTTDMAAAIRAAELKAEIILKATNMDGVYDCENFLEHVSFRELAMKGLSPLDAEAMNHCERHNIPVMLFNVGEPGNIVKAMTGERVGTLIDQTGKFA